MWLISRAISEVLHRVAAVCEAAFQFVQSLGFKKCLAIGVALGFVSGFGTPKLALALIFLLPMTFMILKFCHSVVKDPKLLRPFYFPSLPTDAEIRQDMKFFAIALSPLLGIFAASFLAENIDVTFFESSDVVAPEPEDRTATE